MKQSIYGNETPIVGFQINSRKKNIYNALVNWMLCQEVKTMSIYTFFSGYPFMSDEKVLYPEQQ